MVKPLEGQIQIFEVYNFDTNIVVGVTEAFFIFLPIIAVCKIFNI